MRILVLFVDMVRANLLNINNLSRKKTELDIFLEQLGGVNYSNCFSVAPDTGRALSVFATGLSPNDNGCNNRVKYPRFFIKNETIFDILIHNDFECNYFLHQHNILPKHIIQNNSSVQLDGKLQDFCQNIKLKEKHFIFMDIQSYHSILDNYGYSRKGEETANKILTKHLNEVFRYFNKDDFDDIFIFSDHGFKFGYEQLYQKVFKKKYLLLNEDRTNILMFHRKKNTNILEEDNSLMGLDYIYNHLKAKINSKKFQLQKKDYIVIEDHVHFKQKFTNIQIWAIVSCTDIYIRTFDEAFLVERNSSKLLNTAINTNLDKLIANESVSFNEILQIIESKKTTNSYGLCVDTAKKCVPRNKFLKKIDIIIDSIWNVFNAK